MSNLHQEPATPIAPTALVSRIGHDFNNLLSVILGGLSLLRDELPPSAWDDEARAVYDDIVSAARDASITIVQLTAWAGRQVLEPRATDLNRVAGSLSVLLQRTLPQDISLELHLDPRPVMAWVDPDRLQDCLLNLAANARDAMPAGGILRLITSCGDGPTLQLRDSGQGMDEVTLASCRQPYFTTRTTGHHKGLGLSVVDGFTRSSAAQLTLRSEPGKGTDVTIRFAPPPERQPGT